MKLTDFTTYDEIRSELGLDSEELEDSVLAQPIRLNDLLEEMASVDSRVLSTYQALPDEDSRTEAQARFGRLVHTFSTRAVAVSMLPSLSLLAPRSETDGKAAYTRFNDPFKTLIDGLKSRYAQASDRLLDALLETLAENRGSVIPTVFLAVGLPLDPVTE